MNNLLSSGYGYVSVYFSARCDIFICCGFTSGSTVPRLPPNFVKNRIKVVYDMANLLALFIFYDGY